LTRCCRPPRNNTGVRRPRCTLLAAFSQAAAR
jgi:hypothetical protein